MSAEPDAAAVAMSFIERINGRDLEALAALMTEDHQLQVFNEQPVVGQQANRAAWRGYFDSFPRYRIHPHRTAERGRRAAVLGHTTGSHLGLADEHERLLTLIWVADVDGGSVRRWRLIEDSPENRAGCGLDP